MTAIATNPRSWCGVFDDRDYAITTIETEDGNLWDIEDYVAPRSVKLAVTFDTMNTETILDDEVLQIVTVWNA